MTKPSDLSDYIDQEYARRGEQADINALVRLTKRNTEETTSGLASHSSRLGEALECLKAMRASDTSFRDEWAKFTQRVASAALLHLVVLVIVIILLVVLIGLTLSGHRGGTDTTLTQTILVQQPGLKTREFRSASFDPGDSGCASSENDPCNTWFDVEDGRQVPMESIVKTAATGPFVLVVQGGHDSQELKPALRREIGSNLQLAQLRADHALEYIRGKWIPNGQSSGSLVSTTRVVSKSASLKEKDRSLTLFLITAATPLSQPVRSEHDGQ